jgi:hypothetical protein
LVLHNKLKSFAAPTVVELKGLVKVAKSIAELQVSPGVKRNPAEVAQELKSLPGTHTARTCKKYVVKGAIVIPVTDVAVVVVPEVGGVADVVTAYSYSTGVVPVAGAVHETSAEDDVKLVATNAVGSKHEGVGIAYKSSIDMSLGALV